MRLEVGRDESGTWTARPVCAIGDRGQHPFPWKATEGNTSQEAIDKFVLTHRNWLAAGDWVTTTNS